MKQLRGACYCATSRRTRDFRLQPIYEVYGGEASRQVMDETVAWYKTHLPAR
jgi:hypothetical protein